MVANPTISQTAEAPEEATLTAPWWMLGALAFGYFINQGEGQAMPVLFPTPQKLWGLNLTDLGLSGTIRNVLQALSAP